MARVRFGQALQPDDAAPVFSVRDNSARLARLLIEMPASLAVLDPRWGLAFAAAERSPRKAIDAQLFAEAAGGDLEALARLYDRAARDLFGFALALTRSPDLAGDAVQEVFVRLASGRVRAEVAAPRAWLFASVRHAAVDRLRRRRLEVPLDELPALFAEENPERRAAARQAAEALLSLPPKLRAAVWLRTFAGLTFAELGRVLGVPTFTAASRYRLGLARLRRRLKVEP